MVLPGSAASRTVVALDLFSHGMRIDDIAITVRLVHAVQQQRESNGAIARAPINNSRSDCATSSYWPPMSGGQ